MENIPAKDMNYQLIDDDLMGCVSWENMTEREDIVISRAMDWWSCNHEGNFPQNPWVLLSRTVLLGFALVAMEIANLKEPTS